MSPIAWFMPPVCGSTGMAWQRFAAGSALGVTLGVGMFVAIGYAAAWGAARGDVDVQAFIAAHKWALLAGGQSAAVDDGEPGGTAGRPMLDVLRHQDQHLLRSGTEHQGVQEGGEHRHRSRP